ARWRALPAIAAATSWRIPERIADAAHRVAQLLLERLIDLRPKPLDGDVDHVGLATEILVPHFGGDQRARERLALPPDQQLQQQEFLVRQHDLDAFASDLAAQNVELEIGEFVELGFAHDASAQQSANA